MCTDSKWLHPFDADDYILREGQSREIPKVSHMHSGCLGLKAKCAAAVWRVNFW